MKRILTSLIVVVALTLSVVAATQALFSDSGEVAGNTFTAGSLDLKVNEVDSPLTAMFNADNMQPGSHYDGGCVTLKNAGSLPGRLIVKVDKLVSNENGLLAPEITDGDQPDTEIDPTGYDNNTGTGELWDQISVGFCLEAGAGSHSTNGVCDWDDIRFKAPGSVADDYSSTYSIKTDFDYAESRNIVLQPGDEKVLCTELSFYDDATNHWWGGLAGLTNNMAMTDDAQMDFEFGLVQVD